jgi:hypothetical protein
MRRRKTVLEIHPEILDTWSLSGCETILYRVCDCGAPKEVPIEKMKIGTSPLCSRCIKRNAKLFCGRSARGED